MKDDDLLLAYLAETARKGQRCPTSRDLSELVIEPIKVLRTLADRGMIRVEVFGRNFRRVTIVAGEYAGLATAPPPAHYAPPYLVYGADHD